MNFCEIIEKAGYLCTKRLGQELRSHILFTDESVIELHPHINSNNAVIRTSDKKSIPVNSVPKKSEKIMVVGGICSRGKTPLLVFNSGLRINAAMYQEAILPVYFEFMKNKTFFPSERKIMFQQDMAPAHSAKSTMKLIEGAGFKTWGKGVWPGNSPDLNVIEHMWNELQESVFIAPRPTNIAELKTRVNEKWNSITVDYLKKLVESFPARIVECQTNLGNVTRY